MKRNIARWNIAALAATVLCLGTRAYAMTVAWSGWESPWTTEADGTTPVPQTATIELGTFALNDAGIKALSSKAAVVGAFSVWITGLMGDGTGFDGVFSESSSADGTGYYSKNAYLVVIDGDQYGVFRAPGTVNTDAWVFPPGDAGGPDMNINGITSLTGVLIGNFNVAGRQPNPFLEVDADTLNLIPEPSTVMLVGAGLLGVLGMIRRRRSEEEGK